MSRFLKTFVIWFAVATVVFSGVTYLFNSELAQNKDNLVDATVVSVDKITKDVTQFTSALGEDDGINGTNQVIEAKIDSGVDKDKIVTLNNDYVMLSVGDNFFLNHTPGSDGKNDSVNNPNRLGSIMFFLLLFVTVLFLFGGKQGMRGLISLIGSIALIMYVLIPAVLHGYSPILMSLGIASVIIIFGSFITHGFNRTTLSAVIGMICTIIFTGFLADLAVRMTYLTGYATEESTYLNMSTHGTINMAGLLLGGILIGLLGVLYDIAIGQAISVEELIRANPTMHKTTLYKRTIRIGREHIGALVNTLAIAYVGVSLPLLLYFSTFSTSSSVLLTINQELFATEIIRTLVGSIGLIIAVPITTLITVFILTKAKVLPQSSHSHSH